MFVIDNQLVCTLYAQEHNTHTNNLTITINIVFYCGVQF